jgi:hypothetical protein
MSRKPVETDALKIANQYRRRPHGMVCELRSGAEKLAVHVWQPDASASPDWWVEAHSGSGADEVVVGKSAASRAEALRDVGAEWIAESHRPSFDWEAVGQLLTSVRIV